METIKLNDLLEKNLAKAKDHGDKLTYNVQNPKVVQLCKFLLQNMDPDQYFCTIISGNDKGMKKDTFVIGNKGYRIWIEKLIDLKYLEFKGRYACTIPSDINDEKVPNEYSLKDAVVSIIPGINFQRCQNKIPLDFDANVTKSVMRSKDLYCNF